MRACELAARQDAGATLTVHKDEWILAFVEALQKLRPDMPRKFAWTVAAVQYGNHSAVAPATAAKRWAAQAKG